MNDANSLARPIAAGREHAQSALPQKRSSSSTSPPKTEDGADQDDLVGEGRWLEGGRTRQPVRIGGDAAAAASIDSPAVACHSSSSSTGSSPRHLRPSQWLNKSGECSGAGSPMMAKLYLLQHHQQQADDLSKEQQLPGPVSSLDSSSDAADQPSALADWERLRSELVGKQLVVFLDYDGTLTPIVSQPSAALISSAQRQRLATLASSCPVAIVTGRKLDTITNFLDRGGPLAGLDRLYFAGSHGFDIRCPSRGDNKQVAAEYLPHLASFRDAITLALADMPGAQVEDNVFSISVHYRNVSPEDRPRLDTAVDAALASFAPGLLRKTHGHKVWEIRADFDWHKGAAVDYLMQLMCADLVTRGVDAASIVPIYIGDDTTDEDAFRTLRTYRNASTHPQAIGVFVRQPEKARPSAATHVLASPDEVGQLLERLAELTRDQSR